MCVHDATARRLSPRTEAQDVGAAYIVCAPLNIFAGLPPRLPEQVIDTLLDADHLRIERIAPYGHASPRDLWYDQPEHEWVVLLKGAARLRFAGQDQPVELKPGDFVNIPVHRRHQVEWTTPDEPTIWLAMHYR